ncbi:MAG: NAD(P)H-dependent glycerol-3-phosphate dehydrogenase [Pseudomonadota bacterium]
MTKTTFFDYTIGVVGAGSWGTTLAHLFAEKGFPVTLWVYEKELFTMLSSKKCNTFYLPDIELNAALNFTQDIKDAVSSKNIVLWVTPVKFFGKLFMEGLPFFSPETIHISASKGIETETLLTVSQIAEAKLKDVKDQKFAVLSGPSFAQEVSKKTPTAVVIASKDIQSAVIAQKALATPYFRTYTSDDILGVEIGGALKNVIAVASGIVDGLGLGKNTQAALITRGLAEIMRLGSIMGASPLTFSGLSGIGDLLLTCTSTMSRNYHVGREIGRGRTLEEILVTMKTVAEGVYTSKAAFALSLKHAIEMPIIQEIHRILFEGKQPLLAVKDLMSRALKQEVSL